MRGEKRNQRFRGLSWKPYPTNFGFDLTGRNAVAQLSPASEETRIVARCRADGVRDAGAPARGGGARFPSCSRKTSRTSSQRRRHLR